MRDVPSNWFSLHPIQSRKSHEAIIKRAERKVAWFMERILSSGKVWFTANNLYEITWGFLLSLISVAYLFIGRFFLAKLFFANKNCDGCGVCASYCSVEAIKMWGKENPRPFWRYNCESCMRCAAFCISYPQYPFLPIFFHGLTFISLVSEQLLQTPDNAAFYASTTRKFQRA